MAISKRTLTRHLNQLMKLEANQMVKVSSVVTQARNELAAKMEANPQLWQGGSLDRSLRGTLELIPQLADERFDAEALATEGITEGKELVVEESGAFPGSLVDLYSPTLDLAAVAAKRSEFNGLIRDVTDELAARIETEIRVSIISGEGTQDTLDRILGTGLQGLNGRDGVFRAAKFRAEMIARTEANDVINMGKQTTYSQMNEEFEDLGLRKKWDNIGDGRTSDICRELIGQVVEVDESFVSSRGSWQRPPAHPFCRSTIVPTSDGWSVPKDNKKKRETQVTQDTPEATTPDLPQEAINPYEGYKPSMTEAEAIAYVQDSAVQRTYYHGTRKAAATDIQESGADMSKNTKGAFGKGLYLAGGKETAEGYAETYAEDAGVDDAEVIKVKVLTKNPATYATEREFFKFKESIGLSPLDSDPDAAAKMTRELKKRGYDSVLIQDVDYLVPFDREQIVVFDRYGIETDAGEFDFFADDDLPTVPPPPPSTPKKNKKSPIVATPKREPGNPRNPATVERRFNKKTGEWYEVVVRPKEGEAEDWEAVEVDPPKQPKKPEPKTSKKPKAARTPKYLGSPNQESPDTVGYFKPSPLAIPPKHSDKALWKRQDAIDLDVDFQANTNPVLGTSVNPLKTAFDNSTNPETRARLQSLQGVMERQGIVVATHKTGETRDRVLKRFGDQLPQGRTEQEPWLLGDREGTLGYTGYTENHVNVKLDEDLSILESVQPDVFTRIVDKATQQEFVTMFTGNVTLKNVIYLKEAQGETISQEKRDVINSTAALWVTVHEVGHQMHFRSRGIVPKMPKNKRNLFQYEEENDQESYAEGFAAYVFNPAAYRRINPDVADMFDRDLEDLMRFTR